MTHLIPDLFDFSPHYTPFKTLGSLAEGFIHFSQKRVIQPLVTRVLTM